MLNCKERREGEVTCMYTCTHINIRSEFNVYIALWTRTGERRTTGKDGEWRFEFVTRKGRKCCMRIFSNGATGAFRNCILMHLWRCTLWLLTGLRQYFHFTLTHFFFLSRLKKKKENLQPSQFLCVNV